MFKEALQLFQDYGLVTVLIFGALAALVRYVMNRLKVWNERDRERVEAKEGLLYQELSNHQFFTNLTFKINNEIPTLDFNGVETPVRQKLFRKLLELKLQALHEVVNDIVKTDTRDMTPAQWATFINSEMVRAESRLHELASKEGIPYILISKFMVWRQRTTELLNSYINDLAISTVYTTNLARTNTLLYLLNLKLITVIGDAERSLVELNGEISGLQYKGELIE